MDPCYVYKNIFFSRIHTQMKKSNSISLCNCETLQWHIVIIQKSNLVAFKLLM